MIDHVIERLSLDGYAELLHRGEVRLTSLSGGVVLGKEGLLGRSFKRPPLLDASLEVAQLTLFEAAFVAVLEILEEGLGLKPWVELEFGLELGPNDDNDKEQGDCFLLILSTQPR